jgi:sigma-B regulation protein RsbU (phosphoserine phosphatase)
MINVAAGDLYVIYSDGIIETMNTKGDEFGFIHLKEILHDSMELPVEEISARIYRELNTFGTSHDDQSLILVRLK